MSKSKNRKDNDFENGGSGTGGGFISDEDDETNSDEVESDELSADSEAGPSSPRLKRLRRTSIIGGIGGTKKGKEPVAKSGKKTIGGKGKGKAWEGALEYTWDAIREDEDGGLAGAMSDAILGSRAKR